MAPDAPTPRSEPTASTVHPWPEKLLHPEPHLWSSDTEAGAVESALTFRCWGTRGSIPSPGPLTARYGGNTSCLEVRHGDERLVFDAGSGIRLLGRELLSDGNGPHRIFLTHFHWDHIQGFPFFAPLFTPDAELEIVAPEQGEADARTLLAGQLGPIYFPVPFSAVGARMSFRHPPDDTWHVGEISLRSIRAKHPSHAVGYRVEVAGRAICFIPDNELEGVGYDVGDGWRERFVDFVRGADVLIHDAMYTDEEYPSRKGWGHSTFSQCLRLAEQAGVSQLLFFHHDPDRSDEELDEIVSRLGDEAVARGCAVGMKAAAEGLVVRLEAR